MKFSDFTEIARCYVHRDDIILTDFSRTTNKNMINLHWWKMHGELQNVGDYISTVVVDYVKGYYNLSNDVPKDNKTKHLYAIGSIVDGGYQNATIWGSGLLRGSDKYIWRNLRRLDIRAVRGPKTRNVLINNGYKCPEIYGDPAILMPKIYQPVNIEKKQKFGLVYCCRYDDRNEMSISPLVRDYKVFIDKIVQSERIISSSLHGIILAESYGVPAVLLDEGNMNLFKYEDYYYSTGRTKFPIAKSIDEAMNVEPVQIPDFSDMRKNLLKAFPTDLWF